MNAIEKLYDELDVCGCDPDECLGCEVPRKVREGLQAVERDYLPLPTDRNGEVLRIGEKVWLHDETDADPHIVRGYGMTNGADVDVFINHADEGWCPNTVTVPDVLVHRKPDPLKELISEAALEIIDVGYQNVPSIGNVPKISVDEGRLDEWLEVNAERIRDMLGGAE